MAIYVRSTDGSDSDNGSSWALAKATLEGADGIDSAGDTIYVSQSHAESTSSFNWAFAGTAASPTKIICGNDAAEPPTSVAATATVTATTTATNVMSGFVYVRGIKFAIGGGASAGHIELAQTGYQTRWKSCEFSLTNTSTISRIRVGVDETRVILEDCNIKFASTGQGLNIGGGYSEWNGGSLLSGGSNPTSLVYLAASGVRGGVFKMSGFDLSNAAAGVYLVNAAAAGSYHITFRNCKLPTSWSGAPTTGTLEPQCRVEMFNCSAGDYNFHLWVQDYSGAITHETTIVRTGGASDGTTALSWKMVSNANCGFATPLVSPEIVVWNDTTDGSTKTVTVEIVTDNVTLTDNECWLEVQFPDDANTPLTTFLTDANANMPLASANQTTSSETWTTTGLATPVKQKLSVDITPDNKGFIHARVILAKPSTTLYACPKLTVA